MEPEGEWVRVGNKAQKNRQLENAGTHSTECFVEHLIYARSCIGSAAGG